MFNLICIAILCGPAWADQCRKAGENYNAENMNLPACESDSSQDPFRSGNVWGSESSFNSQNGGGSMGSTWGNPGASTGSGSGRVSAPGARGEHTSTGSGWKAGGTGSGWQPGGTGSGWKPGTTGSGNSRDPASVAPTQNSQMNDANNPPQTTPTGNVNSTNNNSGDAHWIK